MKTTSLEKLGVLTMCVGVILTPIAGAAAEIQWQPQGSSTDISDSANWAGGVLPGNGDRKKFGNGNVNGDYTVTIPAATVENPYRDKAGLVFDAMNDGQTVILDATGTSWLQMGDESQAWQDNVPFRVRSYDHIFDIDNAHVPSATVNHFGFSLTNGKITFTRDMTNGSTLIFDGDFNMAFAPDGTEGNHRTVLFHDTNAQSANSKIILRSGSSTFRNIQFRGKTAGNEFLVAGGNHHVYNGFTINDDKGNSENDAYMHVTNGSFTVENGGLWLGKSAYGKGILRIDGDGLFTVGSDAVVTYFPDGATYSALLSIGGRGRFVSNKNIAFGHNGGTGEILVEDDGTFECPAWFPIGEADNCNLTVTVKDRGQFLASNAGIVQGTGRKLHMTVQDSATAEIRCNNDMANNATAEFKLDLKDNAVLKIGADNGNVNFGNNSGSTIDFTMTGGSLERYSGGEVWDISFRGGPASTYTIAGGVVSTCSMRIEGVQNDNVVPRTGYTNTVRVTGGTVNVRMNGSGDGLDIRGNDRNAMMLVEGGELNIGTQGAGMVRIGHAGNGNGYHSVLRQTGGVMNLGAVVNICDSNASGEIELFGGVCRAWTIRGWNYSDVRGGSNAATLYGNGGTIVPWGDNLTFFYTMSAVYVGEYGLTVDTKGYNNVMMKVKVEDKDGADGLFVKKGAGTLKVGLVENDSGAKNEFIGRSLAGEQTYTRIDEGKLIFADTNEVVFGENVIVKGGATLSLEGTPETMTVDTLTLGDGHGFAVLKLDAGDTVVVNSANGITALCGVLDVPWKSTEGTYAVFTCKAGVATSELDKFGVLDADVTKDYAWTTEVDEGTGYTICSVIVAPTGTLTKTITYADGSVTTNGTGLVSGIVATADGAQSGSIALAHAASASVEDGKTLSLGGPLVATGSELVKTGSGLLTVSGPNPDFYGSFMSRGGTFAVDNVGAFGPAGDIYFPLILGGGTFRYTGTDEAVFGGGLKIAADEKKKQVILDNDGDMTFKSTEYVQGGFVKTGVGTLKFDLPAGTFALGSGDASEDIGANAGVVNLPANGDSPTSNNGLYGVTVLEGTVKVVGEGRDKTTLETRNRALLGARYPAQAAPKLVVEDARINWGAGGRQGAFCHDVDTDAALPVICLTNAMLWSDSPVLGRFSYAPNPVVKLFMKDSEYYGHYNSQVGSGTVAVTVDAENSQMHSNGMIGWTVQAKELQADFHGADAEFGSFDNSNTGNEAGRISFYNQVTGELLLRDGATLRTTRGVKMNSASLDVVFDGGRFLIDQHNVETCCTSVWNVVSGTGFTTQGAGMTVDICGGSTHGFNFPIKGTGKVVKAGAGTFELVAPRAEGETLIQYTGGTVVSNGTLVVDGSLVADGAKVFEVVEGATLDLGGYTLSGATFSGSGTVTNGTLSMATVAYDAAEQPTFSDIVFGETLFVDFGKTAGDPLDKAAARAGIVVAHYVGDAPVVAKVKAVNTGIAGASAKLTCVDGDIVVSAAQSGFAVLVR